MFQREPGAISRSTLCLRIEIGYNAREDFFTFILLLLLFLSSLTMWSQEENETRSTFNISTKVSIWEKRKQSNVLMSEGAIIVVPSSIGTFVQSRKRKAGSFWVLIFGRNGEMPVKSWRKILPHKCRATLRNQCGRSQLVFWYFFLCPVFPSEEQLETAQPCLHHLLYFLPLDILSTALPLFLYWRKVQLCYNFETLRLLEQA